MKEAKKKYNRYHLGVIRRNLNKCPAHINLVKSVVYTTLVHPILEYTCGIGSTLPKKNLISERTQRQAAYFVHMTSREP